MRRKLIKGSSNNDILLSILIPTLYTRKKFFSYITDKIMKQIKEHNLEKEVEIISHFDNKTIGLIKKRYNMFLTSSGKFIAHLDDDDDISDDYIISIINSIKKEPEVDVVTFKQQCYINNTFFVVSGLEYHLNMDCKRGNTYYRYPWLWCVWKRKNIEKIDFEDILEKPTYGEDGVLLTKFKNSGLFKTQVNLDKILHYYNYDSNISECKK